MRALVVTLVGVGLLLGSEGCASQPSAEDAAKVVCPDGYVERQSSNGATFLECSQGGIAAFDSPGAQQAYVGQQSTASCAWIGADTWLWWKDASKDEVAAALYDLGGKDICPAN